MDITKRKFWTNQAVVCINDDFGLVFGQTYIVKYIVSTDFGEAFYLNDEDHYWVTNLFIPKLDYIEIEQKVYELFYNN